MSETVIEEPKDAVPAPADEQEPIDPVAAALPKPNPLSLPAQVEALLYASKEPATINSIATALEATTREVEDAVEQLTEQYQWRGIRVQRQGNKLQLVTAPEVAERLQKFLGLEEINRLSAAALETLAIIAYNQPMTKPQIEMIRGVNCDGVMNTLEARNLIVELGRADTVGHPMRYGVSFEFLQYFGLKSTHELPPVTNLDTLPKPTEEKSASADEASATDGPKAVDAAAPVAAVVDQTRADDDDADEDDEDIDTTKSDRDSDEDDEDEDDDEDDDDEDDDDEDDEDDDEEGDEDDEDDD
jgi:segregation and condensation protein B